MFALRFIRRVFIRIFASLLFVLIKGRRVLLVTAGVAVLGWIALANVNRLPIPAGSLPSFLPVGGANESAAPVREIRRTAASGGGTISAEQTPAVSDYIKGLTQFDASLMWGALADDAINGMKARGGSVESIQASLDDAKRRGARYEDVTMIGNYPLSDGRRYLFYVLSRRGFAGPDQLEQVFFVFTVNRDGKITKID